jgi:hypothetical protein
LGQISSKNVLPHLKIIFNLLILLHSEKFKMTINGFAHKEWRSQYFKDILIGFQYLDSIFSQKICCEILHKMVYFVWQTHFHRLCKRDMAEQQHILKIVRPPFCMPHPLFSFFQIIYSKLHFFSLLIKQFNKFFRERFQFFQKSKHWF